MKQATLANWIGYCLRSIKYGIAELVRAGFLLVTQRGPTSAIYKILQPECTPFCTPSAGSSLYDSEPYEKTSKTETPTTAQENMEPEPLKTARATPYSEAFEGYIGVFMSAGKPLNDQDVFSAWREWREIPVAEQLHAVRDAVIVLQGTREARYMPFPVNHLRGRGWTRRALERTLPYHDPRPSKIVQSLTAAAKRLGIA